MWKGNIIHSFINFFSFIRFLIISDSFSFWVLIAPTKKRTTKHQSAFMHQTFIIRLLSVTVSASDVYYIRINSILTYPYPLIPLCPHSYEPIRSYYPSQIFSIFWNYPLSSYKLFSDFQIHSLTSLFSLILILLFACLRVGLIS